MKYCFNCNKSMPEELENCFHCKTKLLDFKYKVIQLLFEVITYIGLFVTTAMCFLIPFTFIIGWLMNLMVTKVTFIHLLNVIKLFYSTPFINEIPLFIFVIMFIIILILGFTGLFIVNNKIKNLMNVKDDKVSNC